MGGPRVVGRTPQPAPEYKDPAWELGQTIVDRYDSTVDHDDYSQPAALYGLFDEAHRERLASAIAGALGQARREVQERQLCHFFRVDPTTAAASPTSSASTSPP